MPTLKEGEIPDLAMEDMPTDPLATFPQEDGTPILEGNEILDSTAALHGGESMIVKWAVMTQKMFMACRLMIQGRLLLTGPREGMVVRIG